MAKSKVKKKGSGFIIEGVLNFENQTIEVEELGEFPFEKIFSQFDGKLIKLNIDEPDTEILAIPEDDQEETEE